MIGTDIAFVYLVIPSSRRDLTLGHRRETRFLPGVAARQGGKSHLPR
jgi:hypothetical protein